MAQYRNKALLKAIGLVAKELRQSKKLSLESVTNDYNLKNDHNLHFARIEQGNGNMTVSTLSLLCRYYDISLTDFFRKVDAVLQAGKV
ncbi:MAG: hypothetical protein BGO09_10385 [Bacteroidetes bacterium 47-18]|nr:MAG: hypothetical protein BGO09_10385 [Bacteroidetes bacterium 47-18]